MLLNPKDENMVGVVGGGGSCWCANVNPQQVTPIKINPLLLSTLIK